MLTTEEVLQSLFSFSVTVIFMQQPRDVPPSFVAQGAARDFAPVFLKPSLGRRGCLRRHVFYAQAA